MSGYSVFCVKNPCGFAVNKWCAYFHDWRETPSQLTDINMAYAILQLEVDRHKECGCEFIVKEVE